MKGRENEECEGLVSENRISLEDHICISFVSLVLIFPSYGLDLLLLNILKKISGILGRLPKWCNSLDWLMPCSINLHSWLPLQLDLCPNQFLFLSFFICIILTNQGKHNHVNQINFLHILNHFVFYLNKQSLFNNRIENNDNCVIFKELLSVDRTVTDNAKQ